MAEYSAFIDESGNTDLDTTKEGVTKYYVLVAVVVKDEGLLLLENAIECLRAKHYGAGG